MDVLLTSKGLPPEIIASLARGVRATRAEPGFAERMTRVGAEPAAERTPESTRIILVAEREMFRDIVSPVGLQLGR